VIFSRFSAILKIMGSRNGAQTPWQKNLVCSANRWSINRNPANLEARATSPMAGLCAALSRRNCVHHAEDVAFEFAVSHEHRRSGSDVQLQHAQQEA
jgi:hypothetical protein